MIAKNLEQKDIPKMLPLFQGDAGNYHVYSTVDSARTPMLLLNDFKDFYMKNKNTTYVCSDDNSKGLVSFRKLAWDSEIFGFNCSELKYLLFSRGYSTDAFNSLMDKVDSWAQENDVKFMVSKISHGEIKLAELMRTRGFECIEELVTLRHDLSQLPECEMNIRKVNEKEVERVGEIASNSFVYTRFVKDRRFERKKSAELSRRWVINCCRGRSDSVLVAEANGEIAGFITCNVEKIPEAGIDYGDIQLVAVDKKYRGLGIGDSLVSAALNWFRDNKCRFVDVCTQSDNAPALKLYEKKGFERKFSRVSMHKWF